MFKTPKVKEREIDEFFAGLTPTQKVDLLEKLPKKLTNEELRELRKECQYQLSKRGRF